MADHHFIPQFYLKGFLDPDTPAGQEPFIWVHEAARGWRKKAPRNVASRAGFYAIPDDHGGHSEEGERLMSVMEGIASARLRELMAVATVSAQTRAEFATFIALMQARIPTYLEPESGVKVVKI